MALQVASDPPQAFFAGFELKGNAKAGELLLFSPLGSTLAALSWTPETATLTRGGEVRQFDSVDSLVKAATGTAFPVEALFAWLDGDNASVSGWQADLSRRADGRVTAARTDPLPPAELKVVLEQ
ncbi:MAG: lipoprotein insertase outer membrane protein LolB [Burkholderiales bacterium]